MDWLIYCLAGLVFICTLANICFTILAIIETNDFLYAKKMKFLEWLHRRKNGN